ncbi:MAG: c-type cytochrome [Gemmatimonadaceae bacterium]|nr:c-type cytochrome [Gemmatimonadaceae bacterium]
MRWRTTALAVLVLAACRGEHAPGAVPIDTAASLPTMDTASRTGFDTTRAPIAPESSTVTAPTPPAAPSVVLIADSAAGDTLFHRKGRCFTCHGLRGAGTPRLGPALTDSTWLETDGSLDAIRRVIADGVARPKAFSVAMPAYAGTLAPAEIARIAAYVYSLSHPGSAVADTAHADTTAAPRDSAPAPAGAPRPDTSQQFAPAPAGHAPR